MSANAYADHVERMATGYAELSQIGTSTDDPVRRAARELAWTRTQALAAEDAALWGELPARVTAKAQEIKNAGISR